MPTETSNESHEPMIMDVCVQKTRSTVTKSSLWVVVHIVHTQNGSFHAQHEKERDSNMNVRLVIVVMMAVALLATKEASGHKTSKTYRQDTDRQAAVVMENDSQEVCYLLKKTTQTTRVAGCVMINRIGEYACQHVQDKVLTCSRHQLINTKQQQKSKPIKQGCQKVWPKHRERERRKREILPVWYWKDGGSIEGAITLWSGRKSQPKEWSKSSPDGWTEDKVMMGRKKGEEESRLSAEGEEADFRCFFEEEKNDIRPGKFACLRLRIHLASFYSDFVQANEAPPPVKSELVCCLSCRYSRLVASSFGFDCWRSGEKKPTCPFCRWVQMRPKKERRLFQKGTMISWWSAAAVVGKRCQRWTVKEWCHRSKHWPHQNDHQFHHSMDAFTS